MKTLLPQTTGELHATLVQVHENRDHIKSVDVDHQNRFIRVDLGEHPAKKMDDFQIPLKGGTTTAVEEIVRVMFAESKRGVVPSRVAAEKIFEFMDHGAR